MQTNRAIKTTTALRNALTAAGLDAADTRTVIAAIKSAASDGTATSGARVIVYPDGWVPSSYRYRAPGRRVTVEVAPFGVTVDEDTIDRKRPHGRGPRVSVRALRPGLTAGTLVETL